MRLKKIEKDSLDKYKSRKDSHTWLDNSIDHINKTFNINIDYLPFGKQDVLSLTHDDIDALYDESERRGKVSPFIFSYDNILCKFAIKREFKEFFIEYYQNKYYPGYIFNDKGKASGEGLFQGFHDGKTSEKDAASYVELLLAFGINRDKNMSFDEALNDAINKYKVSSGKLTSYDKIKKFITKYESNAIILAKQLKYQINIDNSYTAGKLYKQKYTSEFIKAGGYSNINTTVEAKTDIVLDNGIDNKNLSIKYGDSSQIFSMVKNEFTGMVNMMQSISEQDKDKINKDITNGMYVYNGRMSDKSKEEKEPFKIKNQEHLTTWNDFCTKHPGFRDEFLMQGITGECKFGKDSLGTAHLIVQVDIDLLNLHVYTPQEYLDRYWDVITDNFSGKNGKEAFRARKH